MAPRERVDPHPGPGKVAVRVVACGTCRSEPERCLAPPGMRPRRIPPPPPGHEFTGTLKGGSPKRIKRAVMVNPLVSRSPCARHREGKPRLCPKSLIGLHRPETFAENVAVPLKQPYLFSGDLPPWGGTLAEPLAAALHPERLTGPVLGTRTLVIGGGTIGAPLALALSQGRAGVMVPEPREDGQNSLRALGFRTGKPLRLAGLWLSTPWVQKKPGPLISSCLRIRKGETLILVGVARRLHPSGTLPRDPGDPTGAPPPGELHPHRLGLPRRCGACSPDPRDLVETRSPSKEARAFRNLGEGQASQPKILLTPQDAP